MRAWYTEMSCEEAVRERETGRRKGVVAIRVELGA